jgi:hypothetical protein
VRSLAEVAAPVVMALMLASVSHLNLRYPMDSSFLLTLTACLCFLLYIATLSLKIQYRGDFGLIADGDEIVSSKSFTNNNNSNNSNNNNYNGDDNSNNLRDRNKNKTHNSYNNTHNSPMNNSENTDMGVGYLSTTLFTDFNLLFTSLSNSNGLYNYGNKTNNFKIDLKDV